MPRNLFPERAWIVRLLLVLHCLLKRSRFGLQARDKKRRPVKALQYLLQEEARTSDLGAWVS